MFMPLNRHWYSSGVPVASTLNVIGCPAILSAPTGWLTIFGVPCELRLMSRFQFNASSDVTRNPCPAAKPGSLGLHAPSVKVDVVHSPVALLSRLTFRPSAVGSSKSVDTSPASGSVTAWYESPTGIAADRLPCVT